MSEYLEYIPLLLRIILQAKNIFPGIARDPGSIWRIYCDWASEYFYEFTLFLHTLQKIIQDKVMDSLIVGTYLGGMTNYGLLRDLQTLTNQWQISENLVSSPFFRRHMLAESLTLGGARLSGRHFSPGTYQNQLIIILSSVTASPLHQYNVTWYMYQL